jgi:hypothetical protein
MSQERELFGESRCNLMQAAKAELDRAGLDTLSVHTKTEADLSRASPKRPQASIGGLCRPGPPAPAGIWRHPSIQMVQAGRGGFVAARRRYFVSGTGLRDPHRAGYLPAWPTPPPMPRRRRRWHKRRAAGELPRPSPTIAIAMAAGYDRLMVFCDGCRDSVHVPLRTIRRPPQTQLIDLAPTLVCERCGENGPLPHIEGVTR